MENTKSKETDNIDFDLEDMSEKELLKSYDQMFEIFSKQNVEIINEYFERLKLINELWRVLKRKERKHLIKLARLGFVFQAEERLRKDSMEASKLIENSSEYKEWKAKQNAKN